MARWAFPLLGRLLFLVWVTADSESINSVSRAWCYSKDPHEELPKTLNCNHGNVMSVLQAVPSVYGGTDRRFCQAPGPGPADCPLAEGGQTDHYRRMCNGRSSCVFLLANRPLNTCMFNNGGVMYLHMEYTCTPVVDVEGSTYPVLHPVTHHTASGQGTVLVLQTSDYPSLWENLTQSTCTLQAEPNTTLTMSVRDLSSKARDKAGCPYFIQVGNDTKICAESGIQYQVLTLRENQTITRDGFLATSLAFVISDPHKTAVIGRFWIEFSGFDPSTSRPSPITMTCTNPLAPPREEKSTGGDSSRPLLALIVIPVIIIIVIVVIIVVLLIIRLRKKKKEKSSEPEAVPESDAELKPETEEKEKLTNHTPSDPDNEREPTEDENLNSDKDREKTEATL